MAPEQRPTEKAFSYFNEAVVLAKRFRNSKDQGELGQAVESVAYGLMELSTGMRATYILLEEVKKLAQRQ